MEIITTLTALIVGGAITWFVQSRLEERRRIEERLLGERAQTYEKILDPYVKMLSGLSKKAGDQEKVLRQMLSEDYRRTSFKLSLIGSDEVVRAYNDMMTWSFQAERDGTRDSREMMYRWGRLLLEIRRSLGNPRTKLQPIDMLRGMIKDIDAALSDS